MVKRYHHRTEWYMIERPEHITWLQGVAVSMNNCTGFIVFEKQGDVLAARVYFYRNRYKSKVNNEPTPVKPAR